MSEQTITTAVNDSPRGPRIRVYRRPRPSWERGGRGGARRRAIAESLGWI